MKGRGNMSIVWMKKRGQKRRSLIRCRIRNQETQDARKGVIFGGKSHRGGE